MLVNEKYYYMYITTNYTKTVLYTGITNNLQQRIIEHYINRNDEKTFIGKYKVFYLLYYEPYKYVNDAIAREKEIKGWRREKKISLIQSANKNMQFLNKDIFDNWPPLEEAYHRKEAWEQ